MKSSQSHASVIFASIVLILTVAVVVVNATNRASQKKYTTELQAKNQEAAPMIKDGQVSQQVGMAIIKDMGETALTNDKMKMILQKHGFEVKPTATPQSSSAASPTSMP